jgi:hypothetical protein
MRATARHGARSRGTSLILHCRRALRRTCAHFEASIREFWTSALCSFVNPCVTSHRPDLRDPIRCWHPASQDRSGSFLDTVTWIRFPEAAHSLFRNGMAGGGSRSRRSRMSSPQSGRVGPCPVWSALEIRARPPFGTTLRIVVPTSELSRWRATVETSVSRVMIAPVSIPR